MQRDEIASGALFSLAFIACGLLIFRSEKIAALSVPAFFIPLAVRHLRTQLKEDEMARQIEDEVPDILLLASSLPDNSRIDRLVDFIADNSSSQLGKEFRKASERIWSGMPAEEALEKIKSCSNSRPLGRSIDMIINSLQSGADMSRAFREAADDFTETSSLLRERAAAMALQKYTVIAAAIVVPLVLAMVSSMVSGMDFSALDEFGIGTGEKERKEILGAAELGAAAYVAEFGAIASIFLGMHEGRPKKALLYAAMLMPTGLGIYFLAKGM